MKNSRGIIFLEIMIATFVFVVTLAVLSTSYLAMLNLVELSRLTTVANKDVENVMERIQGTNFTNIVTKFPNGAVVATLPGEILSLDGEQITVTYPQGVGVDPLEILATVSYRHKGRALTQTLRTLRTR